MPGDLAATQASFEEFNRVGILAWFDVEPFHNMDRVETNSLSDSNGLQITQAQYDKAKSVLSEYDIIHTHHPHSGFYGKLIAKRLGKPNVHTEHNNHTGFTRKGRVANGITNVLADAVVCVSESVRDSFFNWENMIVKSNKISVVNNGVDVERLEAAKEIGWSIYDMTDIDSEAVLVGSAGALTEQKAHEVLIEAVDQANAESEKPIELVISGGGELREDLEAQIANAEYSDRLHLLGFLEEREQVYKMMHEIDIYAMPSRWEGFCVAALEGMALDNACIFSDIPEFKHPFNDLALFHPLDNSVVLADELVSIAADEKIRKQLAEKGRNAVVESYTLRQTAERYLSQYQTLL
jgi:glycosyltransferase involved in cell wall biosynthesis